MKSKSFDCRTESKPKFKYVAMELSIYISVAKLELNESPSTLSHSLALCPEIIIHIIWKIETNEVFSDEYFLWVLITMSKYETERELAGERTNGRTRIPGQDVYLKVLPQCRIMHSALVVSPFKIFNSASTMLWENKAEAQRLSS